MHRTRTRSAVALLTLFSTLILTGCAAVQQMAKGYKPDLRLAGTRLQGLSFDGLDLVFDIEVDNPNPLPIRLAGLDYSLKVAGRDFVQGRRDEGLDIAAGAKSTVELPLSLDFGELYGLATGLAGQDSAAYALDAGLAFEVPVLGAMRLPLQTTGSLPMVKAPRVEVEGLKVKRLKLTGAEVELQLKLNNPNAFGVRFERLDYRLGIDGDLWAQGQGGEAADIGAKGEGLLRLPLALDFTRMGLGAYRALTGKAPLQYDLEGQLDLGTALPLLPRAAIPLRLRGKIPLRR